MARSEAAAIGQPALAPPVGLEDCERGTIESALHAPMATFEGFEAYPDLPSKTAVLVYGLAKSQACIDGNKRIALILMLEFLSLNGAELSLEGRDSIGGRILAAAASDPGHRDAAVLDLTTWFEEHIVPSGGTP